MLLITEPPHDLGLTSSLEKVKHKLSPGCKLQVPQLQRWHRTLGGNGVEAAKMHYITTIEGHLNPRLNHEFFNPRLFIMIF